MKQLRKMLAQTVKNLDAFTHPRVSVAWQDVDLVYRRVHNPSPDLPGDIIGKKLEDVIADPASAERLTQVKRQILKTHEPYASIMTLRLGPNDHVLDVSIEPTYDSTGQVDGLISVNIDVTDLVAAREQLAEANSRLVKLLDNALDGNPEPRRRKTIHPTSHHHN